MVRTGYRRAVGKAHGKLRGPVRSRGRSCAGDADSTGRLPCRRSSTTSPSPCLISDNPGQDRQRSRTGSHCAALTTDPMVSRAYAVHPWSRRYLLPCVQVASTCAGRNWVSAATLRPLLSADPRCASSTFPHGPARSACRRHYPRCANSGQAAPGMSVAEGAAPAGAKARFAAAIGIAVDLAAPWRSSHGDRCRRIEPRRLRHGCCRFPGGTDSVAGRPPPGGGWRLPGAGPAGWHWSLPRLRWACAVARSRLRWLMGCRLDGRDCGRRHRMECGRGRQRVLPASGPQPAASAALRWSVAAVGILRGILLLHLLYSRCSR